MLNHNPKLSFFQNHYPLGNIDGRPSTSFHRLEESKEQRGIALSSLCRHYTDCPFGDPSSFNFKHPPPTQQSPLRSDPRFCLRPRVSRAE